MSSNDSKKTKIDVTNSYFRFFLTSIPLMLVVLISLDFAWFNISNRILLRKHERDIALSLTTSSTLLLTAYEEEFSGRSSARDSGFNSTLRMLSQTPGVSCVSISGKYVQGTYPPEIFCKNFEIRSIVQIPIDDNHSLAFHLNEKYLDEIKSEAILFSTVFLMSSFFAFIIFNYLGYKNVASVRIRELLKSNDIFFQYSPTPTAEIYSDGTISRSSLSWDGFFGDTHQNEDTIHSVATNSTRNALDSLLRSHFEEPLRITHGDLVVIRADGQSINVKAQIAPAGRHGERAFVSFTDIDRLKRQVELRTEQALKDELTGVGSRRSFYEFYETLEERAGYYCFLIDIDDFKSVNELYGHQVGDAFLENFAIKYHELLGKKANLYRLGGEEFAFVISFDSFGEVEKSDLKFLQRHEFLLFGQRISRSFSGGCTFFRPSEPVSHVLRRCDLYLSRAKQLGKSMVIDDSHEYVFDDHAPDVMLEAIEAEQIQYFFQPIFSHKGGIAVGCEALIRWKTSEGLIMPQNFLNSYYRLTNLLEDEDIRNKLFFNAISDFSRSDLEYVSYNVMANDLRPKNIDSLISHYKTIQSQISVVLEISETSLFRNDLERPIEEILQILKKCGFIIALDDFGKESSNFQRVIEWDIDIIKIDRSLITDINQNDKKLISVKSLKSLSSDLNITLVAEGVETAAEAETLDLIGVDFQQGYFYGRPMEKNVFLNSLKKQSPKSRSLFTN